MQAAIYLIQEAGLFNIPDTGTVNVKQARAFLHIAAWLQAHMMVEWILRGELSSKEAVDSDFLDFNLVLIGPGGTGKSTVLRAAEALIDYFNGAESVRKCAISNTAARLLGGDTLHAMCKLPR